MEKNSGIMKLLPENYNQVQFVLYISDNNQKKRKLLSLF